MFRTLCEPTEICYPEFMKRLIIITLLALELPTVFPACSNDHNFSPSPSDLDADADMDIDGDADGDADADGDIDADSDMDGTDSMNSVDDTDTVSLQMCLENTEDETRCLDCCDCALSDCAERPDCREACAAGSFVNNDDLLEFDVPSEEGEAGAYQTCYLRGDRQLCLACCDCADIYSCGDYKYCRAVCDQIF